MDPHRYKPSTVSITLIPQSQHTTDATQPTRNRSSTQPIHHGSQHNRTSGMFAKDHFHLILTRASCRCAHQQQVAAQNNNIIIQGSFHQSHHICRERGGATGRGRAAVWQCKTLHSWANHQSLPSSPDSDAGLVHSGPGAPALGTPLPH